MPTDEMQTESTFTSAGWNFVTRIWKMCDGPYYPSLWWEICPERPILYVDADATGANNGSNWANAFNHLHYALIAARYGDEIRVAQGTYKPPPLSSPPPPPPPPPPMSGSNETGAIVTDSNRPTTFQLINGVFIKGGYAGFGEPDQDARDIEKYTTILSGDLGDNDREVNEPRELLTDPCRAENCYHVVTGSGCDESAMLDGFTITAGNANGSHPDDNGGGMYNNNGRPTITNCTFRGNSASLGGGMYNEEQSRLTLTSCTFSKNYAARSGGGMRSEHHCSPSLTNCLIIGNLAPDGGGIYNKYSSPRLSNCVFLDNRANISGGGMFNEYCFSTLTNCTFSGNTAVDAGGMLNRSSWPTLTNCILWDNEPNEIVDDVLSSTIVTFSDVKGGWPGTGNIDTDPCFVDANNGDCHLKSQAGRWNPNSQTWIKDANTSPCIDVGDPNSDWTAELWPHGERINMGAYGGTPEASMSLSDAGNIADLNFDGHLCYRDMKLLTDKWLCEALLIPEDLNRDGIVNFTDFAIFAHYLELSALNPNPIDGASGVSANADLSWRAGRGATSHDVYFGTSNPPPFIKNQAATTFDPGTMLFLTTYYWRIDEVNKWGTTTGQAWSFTTTGPGPG